jgi:hypothetical protein
MAARYVSRGPLAQTPLMRSRAREVFCVACDMRVVFTSASAAPVRAHAHARDR